jgi:hypothetical protein
MEHGRHRRKKSMYADGGHRGFGFDPAAKPDVQRHTRRLLQRDLAVETRQPTDPPEEPS